MHVVEFWHNMLLKINKEGRKKGNVVRETTWEKEARGTSVHLCDIDRVLI
jgi:hypothetical protein